MKKREKIQELVEQERVVATYCDKCGAEVPVLGPYETREFQFIAVKGWAYPDGAGGDGWVLEDLCDLCAQQLRNLLENNGYKTEDLHF